jgi:peroxiredoxin (alkyl hydroperoxide reductase subunit C)
MFNTLKVGKKAPHFKLQGAAKGEIGEWDLKDMVGKWVVFFFYPADFTFVCPTEVKGFQAKLDEFEKRNTQVLGCSVDSPFVHKAWAESLGGIDYPLLSDVHHTTSIDYNVFVDEDAQALRGTFIIDPEGTLRWYQVSDNNVGRSVDEVLRVVDALQSGKQCPVDWKPGEKTLDD